jgi:predicted nucleic acid-binding protein
MATAPLLSEIEAFLSEAGIGEHRFGILAAKNGRLVERLRDGRRIWPETEAQVRAYIIAARRAKHHPTRDGRA